MPTYQPRHAKKSRLRLFLLGSCIAALIALIVWMFVEPGTLQIEQHTVINSALSEDVKQLRVIFVSDIHQARAPFYTGAEELISRINALRPDLVLLGGDYAMDSDGAIDFFRSMPPLRATYGVYAVLGDCDHDGPEVNVQLLKAAMVYAGVTPLFNEVVPVRIGASNVYLAGLDDLSAGSASQLGQLAGQCKTSDLTIFLCHNPDIIPQALTTNGSDGRRSWFDLGLFGHTHGGQVALVGGLLGLSRSNSPYQSGWYNPNRIELLVSHGVGTCSLPIRLGCAPQIHVITIKNK